MGVLDRINKTKLSTFFLLIGILIPMFGILYYFITIYSPSDGLYGESPITIFDSLYFSVGTFSSFGLGDIKPLGFSRLLTAIEIALGLISLGILISKLVSYRQEKLIDKLFSSKIERELEEIRMSMQKDRVKLREVSIKKFNKQEDENVDIELEKILKDKYSITRSLHSQITGTYGTLRNLIDEDKSLGAEINIYEIERVYFSLYLTIKEIRASLTRLDSVNFDWRRSSFISNLNNVVKYSELIIKLIDKYFKSDKLNKIKKKLEHENKLLKALITK